MKIHTTQNLNLSADRISTNISMPKQIRYTKYSDSLYSRVSENPSDAYDSSNMSFRGRKNILDKAVESAKRAAKKKSKLHNSGSLDKFLDWTKMNEVIIQAGAGLVICCVFRPAAMLLLGGINKKDKKDAKPAQVSQAQTSQDAKKEANKRGWMLAIGQSISSGIWGFVVPLICLNPLAGGYNTATSDFVKYFKDKKTMLRWYPHLNPDSVKEGAENLVDRQGRKFIADTKDVRKIFVPQHISTLSDETLSTIIKDFDAAGIDRAKSAKEWLNKNKQHIKIDMKDIFIAVEEDGKTSYYPLKFVNPDILKEVFPELDINTVKAGEKHMAHNPLENWKKKDGTAFEFDINKVFVSSAKDADEMIPLTAGYTRKEHGEIKNICYQKNNLNPDDLGTPIEEDMVSAAAANDMMNTMAKWIPDLIITYPRAAATVAVIPFILKHVFGIDKKKIEAEKKLAEEQRKMMEESLIKDQDAVKAGEAA